MVFGASGVFSRICRASSEDLLARGVDAFGEAGVLLALGGDFVLDGGELHGGGVAGGFAVLQLIGQLAVFGDGQLVAALQGLELLLERGGALGFLAGLGFDGGALFT